MRGLVWTLIWLALVAGAAWYLWRRLRWLWGRTEMLGDTLAEAETLFAAATEREVDPRDGVTDHRPQVELAIFRAPADVAQERDLIRETLRGSERRVVGHPYQGGHAA